jgi:hypothetical protein
MNWFDRTLSVVAGFAGAILFANLLELDWQLALMVLRDATYGRFVPEFRIDMDLTKLQTMFHR